jgi:hypothetical protein
MYHSNLWKTEVGGGVKRIAEEQVKRESQRGGDKVLFVRQSITIVLVGSQPSPARTSDKGSASG